MAKAIAAKDEEALQALCDRNLDALYRFIYFRVGPQDIDDLLQETVLKALDSMKSYRGDSSLFTWLCGIAKNVIRAYYRSKAKQVDDLDAVLHRMAERLDAGSVEEEGPAVKQAINLVMSALPLRYQTCLTKKYLEGYSVNQMAEELGSSEKTVESLLTRAREAFKNAFAETTQGEIYG